MKTVGTELKLIPITIAYLFVAISLFPFYTDPSKGPMEIFVSGLMAIVKTVTTIFLLIARLIGSVVA